jgi:Glycosyl hydrolase family 63 C-terminal domain
MNKTAERERLNAVREHNVCWKKWGPYLSERQWGTVREDYSQDGDAWNYFSHDQARSRAYRWGEDGIAGISDDAQHLCFALALWNGKDPILKERLFGLTNSEGNHGEDVKEYYFYLDSTPTHSYMKFLYKYPQRAFPYDELVRTNAKRTRKEFEYELIDTGIFDQDEYFDVFVEYAKEAPENLIIEITVWNRGPKRATLHVLPTIWFRNEWSWRQGGAKPSLKDASTGDGIVISASHSELGDRFLYCDGSAAVLFTENETNNERLFGKPNQSRYVKDSINSFIVHGDRDAVNPGKNGTKAAVHYELTVAPGQSQILRLRLSDIPPARRTPATAFGDPFEITMQARRREADEFYATVIPPSLSPDAANIMRQALAGMLWSKQYYLFDVNKWLEEHGAGLFNSSQLGTPRNEHWHHMMNADIISMPDKWEYPWYAAWDLAFHVPTLTLVDEDFGKQQLNLMLRSSYLHPNGQLPAYEWNFGDVNPPVHAWSTIFTYRLGKSLHEKGDIDWLEGIFQKLMLNFTWWVNRKDRTGRNAFEGGFLGLDNIGVFDRSAPLPGGGYLEQADGTAWMALFCQNMIEIAAELSLERRAYLHMVTKFIEHFLWIAAATMRTSDSTGMWDEEDGFFYDVLRLPHGKSQRLKVRSMVGLLPFCAVTIFEETVVENAPEIYQRLRQFLDSRPELCTLIHDPRKRGVADRRMAAILNEDKLRRVLAKMLDENEFLSCYGIRALSRYHAEHPYVLRLKGQEYKVSYMPAESDNGMFGGNSNWRGPIWMPVNGLIIRALMQYYLFYGNDFTVECPTGSGRKLNLYEVAQEIAGRLESIFLKGKDGRRPVYGATRKFQEDPFWRDYVLFYEYFHGDNGAGLGASHQTGWTGIIARATHLFATTTPAQALELGKVAAVTELQLKTQSAVGGA